MDIFLSWLKRGERKRGISRQAIAHFAPRLESLEDRTVLSTLTVTSIADDGSAGTLRSVLASASPGDMIVFANDLDGHTINLKRGELLISQNQDIEGPGAGLLTISGGDASRIFEIGVGAAVTLAGLTLDHGRSSTNGAGILNAGNLTINNCILTHNQATEGAGIFSARGGSLTVGACSFISNEAISLDSNGFGGAIASTSVLIITESSFYKNLADGSLGVGGAIDASNSTTITDTTFTANVARGSSPGGSGVGGALNNDSNGLMTVANCSFIGNRALGTPGGDGQIGLSIGQGGAINDFGTMTLTGSTFDGNQAIGAALQPGVGPTFDTASAGGAILDGGVLNVSSTTFSNNRVVGGPGGAGAEGSWADGGAIGAFFATLSIDHSMFSNNTALGGAGNGADGGYGIGGAVDIGITTATITDSMFTGNRAVGGAGGGTDAIGFAGIGGAIDVGSGILFGFREFSTLNLIGSTLEKNEALGGAGDLGGFGAWGGGLSVVGGSASVSGSTVVANVALGGPVRSTGPYQNGLGGGIFIFDLATASLAASTVTGNYAIGGSGSQGIGGGVYNLGTFSFDVDTIIDGNHASTSNDNIYP